MTDFYQNRVPTFTFLNKVAMGVIEQELKAPSIPKIGVVIPALYSDLISDAMEGIIKELKEADFVERIYVSVDKATYEEFKDAKRRLMPLGDRAILIWIDGKRFSSIIDQIEEVVPVGPPGKGRAVWAALGMVFAEKKVAAIAFHDADIVTYDRSMLAKLLYPVVILGYHFAKGFYARYTDRLYGRVVRLFYFPLVRALKSILGPMEFLEFMGDFRYPLSGEWATYRNIAEEMRFPSDWGIEVGILAEMYQVTTIPRICQVEIADRYDHKHQQLSAEEKNRGLFRMAADIARAFFTYLTGWGLVLSKEFFHTLKFTYQSYARELVNVYEDLSRFNDFHYDLHQEFTAVETFVEAIDTARLEFEAHPAGSPLIPSWRRVESAKKGILKELAIAVMKDNEMV
jgi:glucosyl-3-phosphoglycerate synthase